MPPAPPTRAPTYHSALAPNSPPSKFSTPRGPLPHRSSSRCALSPTPFYLSRALCRDTPPSRSPTLATRLLSAHLPSAYTAHTAALSLYQSSSLPLINIIHSHPTPPPQLLQCLDSLAAQYKKEGSALFFFRLGQRENAWVEALSMLRRVHGAEKDHPDIARSLDKLSVLYKKQGRDDEAEKLYAEAEAMWRRVHPVIMEGKLRKFMGSTHELVLSDAKSRTQNLKARFFTVAPSDYHANRCDTRRWNLGLDESAAARGSGRLVWKVERGRRKALDYVGEIHTGAFYRKGEGDGPTVRFWSSRASYARFEKPLGTIHGFGVEEASKHFRLEQAAEHDDNDNCGIMINRGVMGSGCVRSHYVRAATPESAAAWVAALRGVTPESAPAWVAPPPQDPFSFLKNRIKRSARAGGAGSASPPIPPADPTTAAASAPPADPATSVVPVSSEGTGVSMSGLDEKTRRHKRFGETFDDLETLDEDGAGGTATTTANVGVGVETSSSPPSKGEAKDGGRKRKKRHRCDEPGCGKDLSSAEMLKEHRYVEA